MRYVLKLRLTVERRCVWWLWHDYPDTC